MPTAISPCWRFRVKLPALLRRSYVPDQIPDGFDDQFRLVQMDPVTTLLGNDIPYVSAPSLRRGRRGTGRGQHDRRNPLEWWGVVKLFRAPRQRLQMRGHA